MEREVREKIKQLFFEHPEVKHEAVAFAVGLSAQTFNYQLYHAKKFDTELEKNIFKYFKKLGIIKYQEGECVMLNDLFLEFTSISSQHVSILANEIRKDISDNKIDETERTKLLGKLYDMRDNVNEKFNELEGLIKG